MGLSESTSTHRFLAFAVMRLLRYFLLAFSAFDYFLFRTGAAAQRFADAAAAEVLHRFDAAATAATTAAAATASTAAGKVA